MLTNYHTHTTYCDGYSTPEEMVKGAISKGFTALGFSAHALYPFSSQWHLPVKNYEAYKNEIERLKKFYSKQIEIYCGYEADYFPPLTTPDKNKYTPLGAEYLIGSVHFISTDTSSYAASVLNNLSENTTQTTEYSAGIPYTCFTVDGPVAEVVGGIKYLFNGDGKKAVQTYFASQRDMMRTSRFDIVGHIDLVRARNGVLHFFDESESWYKHELEATAEVAAQSRVIVELNTGGLARNVIDDIYPSAEFLSILRKHNVPIILNSDAHRVENLDFAFDIARKTAQNAGYREFMYYTKGSWKSCLI